MLPSPADLKYFMEVAQSENISRAAERLGITQPSLSLSIKRLEDNVGSNLLIRTKTGVKLTKAGLVLTKNIQSLVQEWEKIKSETNKNDTDVSGRYTIGCHPTVGLYSLPETVRSILKKHPDVDLKLTHDISRKITEEVINFKVDYGIVVNPVQHPDLVIRELCRDQITLYASTKAGANNETLICDENLLQIQDILKKLNKSKERFTKTIYSPNLEVVASLTAAGVGVGILPGRIRSGYFKFEIERFPGNWPVFNDSICLVYRADTQQSAANKKFTNVLFETLKETLKG